MYQKMDCVCVCVRAYPPFPTTRCYETNKPGAVTVHHSVNKYFEVRKYQWQQIG